MVAVDHLHALATLTSGTVTDGRREMLLHTHAPFTLLRAALENASRAAWLLGPASSRERVHQCLKMNYADRMGNAAKAKLLGELPSESHERHLQRIKNLLRAAGVAESELSNGKLKMPGYGEITRTAGELTGIGAMDAELMWSACSALAHGDLHGSLAVLDRENMSTDGSTTMLKLTPSVKAVLVITTMAVRMTQAALSLYATRASTPL